jgi:hypothetical protein
MNTLMIGTESVVSETSGTFTSDRPRSHCPRSPGKFSCFSLLCSRCLWLEPALRWAVNLRLIWRHRKCVILTSFRANTCSVSSRDINGHHYYQLSINNYKCLRRYLRPWPPGGDDLATCDRHITPRLRQGFGPCPSLMLLWNGVWLEATPFSHCLRVWRNVLQSHPPLCPLLS